MNTIFRLYDGSSPDGRGDATYIGRTDDAKKAYGFWKKVRKNPYSTGYVVIETDTEEVKPWSDAQWERYL